MRFTASDHLESIETTSDQIWRSSNTTIFHPALNFSVLAQLLQRSIMDVAMEQASSKRKLSQSEGETRSSKRKKTTDVLDGAFAAASSLDSTHNGQANVLQDPPTISSQPFPKHHISDGFVPILQHTLGIQYNACQTLPRSSNKPQSPTNTSWQEQLDKFRAQLASLQDAISSLPVELGQVDIAPFGDRWVAITPDDSPLGSRQWICLIPSLTTDAEANHYLPPTHDLLSAAYTLTTLVEPRVALQASLKAVLNQSDPSDLELPLSLQLELTFSINPSNISEPLRASKGHGVATRQDAYRRLFRVAAGLEEAYSTFVPDPINVAAFYSIMQPAPSLLSADADKAMQPASLEATLLPFQRRSVAWLLRREGKCITPDGRIVDTDVVDEHTFWMRFEEGNHAWWLNRLSGQVLEDSDPPVEPSAIHGGILAEEPGLGKTLETIALILLNPAPSQWNPTVGRYDEQHRLNIKAVKTTLIVTPPALAPQWKEEIAKHAPSLKVLIYDGWSKCLVPISNTPREQGRVKNLQMQTARQKKKKAKPKYRYTSPDDDGEVHKELVEEEEEEEEEDDMTCGRDGKLLEWPEYVHQFDVAIVTYATLRADLVVAKAAPDRPRREDVVYSSVGRARSPLVLVEWKRVVMDEVQLAGGAKSEEMVSLVPRLSSLAVSGTPSKAQLSDLYQVLKFLRVEHLIGSVHLWQRLLHPGFAGDFSAFLTRYAVRTTKANVSQELTIPKQTRYLVGVELGRVERHVYDQALEGILDELGLDARGVAATENWQANPVLLRTSIRRLRGICTHPQVGQLQKKDGGLFKSGVLKTMEAVLESMKEQNWRNLLDHCKAKLINLIRNARLLQRKEDDRRYHDSLEMMHRAEKEILRHLEELNVAMAEHKARGTVMKEEAAKLRRERGQDRVQDVEPNAPSDPKGKGKERNPMLDPDDDDDDDLGIPKTIAGDEYRARTLFLMGRIRDVKLLHHQVKFLQGDLYHILANGPEEDKAYGEAEKIRKDFLKGPEEDANNAVAVLQRNQVKKGIDHEELLTDIPFLDGGSIRSSDLFSELNTLIEDVLNPQADMLWSWRTHIIGLLTKSLSPGEEADGQEFQRSLDDQGEVETYLQVYAALLADRREAMSNERTLLAAHDAQEKRLRKTKAAINAANKAAEALLEVSDEVELQPEHEVLHNKLSTERRALLGKLDGRAVRSILVDLAAASARSLDNTERLIIKSAIDNIRKFINKQNIIHDKLEADLTLLRRAFNERIVYFGQLQGISDSVADTVTWEGTIAGALTACSVERSELETNINKLRARDRYLDNLTNTSSEDMDDDDKTCILCRCDFVRGYITQCAHIFCEDCMKLWLTRKDGKTCPVCRVMVQPDTVQRFTVNTENAQPAPQIKRVAGELEVIPQSRRNIEYSMIDPQTLAEIETMETLGDFGSKIQALVRHLLYIKLKEPTAKSIIFSAWADSLQIVDVALRQNGIRAVRTDQSGRRGGKADPGAQKFRNDPDISVLLLHGERENAGLNVTCASRVFLLESVVNHSFELQAIARIDRLGQTQETEVYCYYAEDTLEKNILDLAARRGLSLYTKENAVGTVNISSFVQQDNREADNFDKKDKSAHKGDFIFKVDDMLAILFPHMFEDARYLLEDSVLEGANGSLGDGDVEMEDISSSQRQPLVSIPVNVGLGLPQQKVVESPPVAGPSRLR